MSRRVSNAAVIGGIISFSNIYFFMDHSNLRLEYSNGVETNSSY